jgi:hypothetical protein
MSYTKHRLQKLAGILSEQAMKRMEELSPRVSKSERQEINADLDASGFGGQRHFRSIGEALNVADGVLQKHGLEWGEVNSADNFREDNGHRGIVLARSNREDPFSPAELENTVLAFSWTRMDDDDYRYEVIAYLG